MTRLAKRKVHERLMVFARRRRAAFCVVAQSALDGLRMYPGAAALMAMTVSVALTTILPSTLFIALSGRGIQSRLGLLPIHGDNLGLAWGTMVEPPAATQQVAVDTFATVLMGMTVATLAVAAVTILILAGMRESARTAEIAVRRVVGASHRMLRGGLAFEAAILIGGAVMVGGITAWVLGRAALTTWPGVFHTGTPILATVATVALAAVLGFGILLPVLLPSRRLADGEPPAPPSLVPTAFQLGVSLIVLTMSSLVTRYTAELTRSEAASPNNGAVFPITLTSISPQERAAQYRALLHTVSVSPSTNMVSLTSPGALVGLGPVSMATTDCGYCSEGGLFVPWRTEAVTHHLVSPDSFRVLGLSLLAGRGIAPTDTWEAPRVAVVSRSLARREFQEGHAIGRRIRVIDDGDAWSTVVGVVEDPSPTGFGSVLQPRYAVYLSVLQHPPAAAELVIRGSQHGDLLQAVQTTLRMTAGSSGWPVPWRRESDVVAAESAPAQWFGWWFGVQGWAMLGIGTVGIFALMQLWVRSLSGEIGVRRALGARRLQVLRFVLLRAMGVGMAGVLVALWFGPAIWQIAGTALPGFPAWDLHILIRFAVLLIVSALAGALLPAWRASRSTPVALIAARF